MQVHGYHKLHLFLSQPHLDRKSDTMMLSNRLPFRLSGNWLKDIKTL